MDETFIGLTDNIFKAQFIMSRMMSHTSFTSHDDVTCHVICYVMTSLMTSHTSCDNVTGPIMTSYMSFMSYHNVTGNMIYICYDVINDVMYVVNVCMTFTSHDDITGHVIMR